MARPAWISSASPDLRRRRDHGGGPCDVAGDQADSALTKKPGLALNTAYEAKYGANSRSQFAGHSYDAFEVLKRMIPVALKTAKPGTPEFREAIRQALTERKSSPPRASTTGPKKTATASTTARGSSLP